MPNNIHVVWVASLLKSSHCEKIKDLANKNPNATIYLWVDSKHFYTDSLRDLLKRQSCLASNFSLSSDEKSQCYNHVGGVISDLKRLNDLVHRFRFLSNVEVKDLSDSYDVRLNNRDIYHSQIMKRGGVVASVIVREDIITKYGGVLVDIDD
ncbi:hypothetical protein CGJ34_08445 [Vibrio parahaemolyticus]|uniref:hypothetical protein n=1 Tax=Vibrio parahaemolyticus TaxID=670 RepID=UPI0011203E25|nr:hypothetical protein [Vibrio parahaemolyticus]TOE84763.1 hypothetical protein CGJ34_08445 [Vibrio parahaemolyticus]